jgi:CMP-N,N'-diacetyllegionaminic acid synthase
MKFLAVIPARKGSKGLPGKNIRLLGGRPLVQYTIEAALNSSLLDSVVVSTDDEEVSRLSEKLGVEVIRRPAELATDTSTTQSVIEHTLEILSLKAYVPEAVVTLQPTSPLRDHVHIDRAIEVYLNDPKADSLVSCVPVPHIYHPDSVMKQNDRGYLIPDNFNPHPTRRQDKRPVFARNGAAIYITKTSQISRYIFGGNLLLFEMPMQDSIDIDSQEDLEMAEILLQLRNSRKT